MNPTQEFDTALKGLTPDERATYTTANPIVNVGGANQALGSMGLQAITSQSLQPVRPYTIPEVPNTSVAPGIIQSGLSSSASITAQNEAERKRQEEIAAKQAEQATVKGGLAGIMQKLGLQGERTVQAQEQAGIPQLQKDLDEITSQIESKELAARRQIENLDKTFTGTSAGKQDAIRVIEKNSAREIADLSIIQNARSRNLLTAQTLVNQKIELETEDLKNRFTYLKFFYDENKEFLTKQDDRDFQAAIKKADREYEETKAKVTTLETTKLSMLKSAAEQGAPNSVLQAIQSAQTTESAIMAAGQYGGDMLERQLKKAQIEKALAEAKKAVESKSEVKLTTAQQTALSYANRVADANKIIDSIGGNFVGISSIIGGITPNPLKTSERQQFEQAQRNFINAVLRRESGAAIADSEFDSARKQYFPQPGDQEEVLEQKKLNRERTLENLLREGGQDVDTPTMSTVVTIGGQKVLSGTIIQNATGQRARVNPDGTVTPI